MKRGEWHAIGSMEDWTGIFAVGGFKDVAGFSVCLACLERKRFMPLYEKCGIWKGIGFSGFALKRREKELFSKGMKNDRIIGTDTGTDGKSVGSNGQTAAIKFC